MLFDLAMTGAERQRYDAWMRTSSVTTPHSEETILSFKIAEAISRPPLNVIRSLRGQKGQSPQLVADLERLVDENPSLRFLRDGRVRRVALQGLRPPAV